MLNPNWILKYVSEFSPSCYSFIHRIWIGQSGDKCKTTGSNLARSRGVEKRKQSRGSRETRVRSGKSGSREKKHWGDWRVKGQLLKWVLTNTTAGTQHGVWTKSSQSLGKKFGNRHKIIATITEVEVLLRISEWLACFLCKLRLDSKCGLAWAVARGKVVCLSRGRQR